MKIEWSNFRKNAFQLRQIDLLNSSDLEKLNQKLTIDLVEIRKINGQLETDVETLTSENNQLKSDLHATSKRLKKKDKELKELSDKSDNQAQQIKNHKNKNNEPTLAYEKHRRRVVQNIILFWDYFSNRTREILKMSLQNSTKEFVEDFHEATRQNKM